MLKINDLIGKNKKAGTFNQYKIRIFRYNKSGFLSGVVVRKVKTDKDLGRAYTVNIKWGGQLKHDSPVQVSCTCADFSARWRYVLNKHGSYYVGKNMFALNDKSLTDPPVVTNPNMETGVCKHLEFVLNALVHVTDGIK